MFSDRFFMENFTVLLLISGKTLHNYIRFKVGVFQEVVSIPPPPSKKIFYWQILRCVQATLGFLGCRDLMSPYLYSKSFILR